MPSIFTADQRRAYLEDGYVLIKSLFDGEEIDMLREAIEQDPQIRSSFYDRKDAEVPDSAVKAAGVKFAVGEDANFKKAFNNPPELKKNVAA